MEGKLKVWLLSRALCFSPPSLVVLMSLSLLVWNGLSLGVAFGGDKYPSGIGGAKWGHEMGRRSLVPFSLVHSQLAIAGDRGAQLRLPLPLPSPLSPCCPRLLVAFTDSLFNSGKSPGNPDKATEPWGTWSCSPLWSCLSPLFLGWKPTASILQKYHLLPSGSLHKPFFEVFLSFFFQLTIYPQVSFTRTSSWTFRVDEMPLLTSILKLLSRYLVIACHVHHLTMSPWCQGPSCFCAYDHSVGAP